ncbi:MAG TPA: FAD-binding oxidoreductase [Kofleriaceae bacterium]|nr:FAD-binding oxidoreductase [Kofleriaceae bacterium]
MQSSAVSERHAAKVARIVAQLAARRGVRPLSLRKKAVPHQVPKANDLRHGDAKIDVTELTEILRIDPERRICIAESGVTFVDLLRATLAHGLVPNVFPQLSTITVGGAVSGCSIEAMSFSRGGFHDSCREYEVITATGDVLVCTPDHEHREHRLIFEMMHNSFGTLGILARLTFELVPAKPYVHLVHETHATVADYQAAIRRHAEAGDVDFMDGIIHGPRCYVLCAGRFVDSAPYTSRYDWMKVYYRSTRTRREDYLRTYDYMLRYDRGVTNVRPGSFVGRLLFGKVMKSTQWLWLGDKLHRLLRSAKPPVTLDVFVPFPQVPEFMAWFEREIGFFPLWSVPYRAGSSYPWLADSFWARNRDPLFLDLAIYGMRQRGDTNYHRLIEQKLLELGGMKTLISHNYYSEAEFWSIYNKESYDAVKRITDPDNQFRDLYEKTCRAAMGRSS